MKNKSNYYQLGIMVLLCLILSSSLFAKELSIKDAYSLAKSSSKSYELLVKEYQDYVNEENKVNPFVPSLQVTGSLSTGASFVPSLAFNGLGYSVGASASFSFGPSSYTYKKLRDANNSVKLSALIDAESDLYLNVSAAYLNVLLYREGAKISERALERAQEQYDSIYASYENGESSELDLKTAENTLQNSEYLSQQNRNALLSSERAFKVLSGLDVKEFDLISLEDISFICLPPADEIFSKQKEQSNVIINARNNIALAEANLSTAKGSAYIPTISVSASYTNNGTNIGAYNTQTRNRVSDSLVGSVGISIPISGYIPGSSTNVGVKSAENSVENAKINLELAYDSLFSSIEDYSASLELLESEIEMLSAQIETLEYQVELSTEAYENGLLSLVSLQDVYERLEDAEYSLLSSKVNYLNTLNSLAVLIGSDGEEITTLFN